MPAVQQKDIDKKRGLWVKVHTDVSGGQRKQLVHLWSKYVANPDSPQDANVMAFQQSACVLLSEEWNLPDPEKTGEIVPKSEEGLDRASSKDIDALWKVVEPIVNDAFPNSQAG